MLWQVRALLDDRPGALAALAVSCGDQGVNILDLQIFPAADGRVVDEIVMHTPGGWSAVDVEQLCVLAGVDAPVVAESSPQALEDQPVRFMRAARVVAEDPHQLEDQLCRLLDAFPVDGLPGLEKLVLDDEHGPAVALSRRVPFTDTELARASELRRLAAEASSRAVPAAAGVAEPVQGEPDQVELRMGRAEDAEALLAMHVRCSAETTYRRYHAPLSRISPRLARSLLEPEGGLSIVLAVGDDIVGLGMICPEGAGAELGVMVEDGWQRKGLGTRLLRALAVEAASRGFETVTCMVQRDNDAVLGTIRGAGLRARVTFVDGVTKYRIPVQTLRGTAPLVALLHERRELREAYRPADLVDQAVRDGA